MEISYAMLMSLRQRQVKRVYKGPDRLPLRNSTVPFTAIGERVLCATPSNSSIYFQSSVQKEKISHLTERMQRGYVLYAWYLREKNESYRS